MVNVRKEWESRVFLAIEKARLEKSRLAKEDTILLMVAHDEFWMPSFVCAIDIWKSLGFLVDENFSSLMSHLSFLKNSNLLRKWLVP
ncbi:hypothetical protein V6N13_109524 [Hibiscus sabdariffa]